MTDIFSLMGKEGSVLFNNGYLLFWLVDAGFIGVVFGVFWVQSSFLNRGVDLIVSLVWNQMLFGRSSSLKGLPLIMCALFFFLLMVSFSGMVPYVYPVSVEMGLIISISFPVWLGLVVSSVGFNYKAFIAGFCPMGVHWLGAPFFIVVEVVSLLLRPVTLTMRFLVSMLMGQMAFFVGGSYLVTLVWFKVGFIVGSVFYAMGVFAEVALMLLQCYVFVMLLIHYADEHMG